MKTTVISISCAACGGPLPIVKVDRVKCDYCGCTNHVAIDGKITIPPPAISRSYIPKPAPAEKHTFGQKFLFALVVIATVAVGIVFISHCVRRRAPAKI